MTRLLNDREQFKHLNQVLEAYEITFEESLPKEMFISHMKSLWDRIELQELLEDDRSVYEAILNELDEESLKIAESIVMPYLLDAKMEKNMMEIVLVATHIQVNKTEKGD